MRRESIVLLTVVLGLVLLGVFLVYSASATDARLTDRLIRQLVYVSLGLIAMFITTQINYQFLSNAIVFRIIVFVSLISLALVLVPGIGVVHGGARRWIELGGFSFQPSEFAKFALILLLALKLAENREQVQSFWSGFVPPMLITFLFAGLVLWERDLGTPVVMGAVAFVMIFVAGARWGHILPSVVPAAGIVYALIVTSPHRLERIGAFIDPWSVSDKAGYQLIQSLAAFANGSLYGRGPGASEQKLFYLPAAHTDFIFAVWAEEMGLIGSCALIALFLTLLYVSLRIAQNAPDLFGTLLAGGIISLVTIQAGLNMAVTTGLVPTKGLPLPFISWGGSSLIVFMMMMGVLLNIGKQASIDPSEREHAPQHA